MPFRRPRPLAGFLLLYGVVYAAFGASSPFLPRFLESRGLAPAEIGVLFGVGTAVRLLSAPVAGRVADVLGAVRAVLAICCVGSAAAALGLVRVDGFRLLLVVFLLQGAALAPITTLSDALALGAATPRGGRPDGFEYGWVRGAASAAFVAGSLVAGRVLGAAPLDAVLWMQAVLLAGAVLAVGLVPPIAVDPGRRTTEPSPVGGVAELLGMPRFRRLVVVAALVLGSHAMHDAFAMVRWNAAGIGPAAGSVLWSESVAAEVFVFFWVGPALVDRLGPAGAAACAAVAGVVRWTTMSWTTAVAALGLVQPLHGLTFALLHLAAMRIVAASVPTRLAATAQGLYALGATGATALLMAASGPLYARVGAPAFLAMAALCAVATPLTAGLRAPSTPATVPSGPVGTT